MQADYKMSTWTNQVANAAVAKSGSASVLVNAVVAVSYSAPKVSAGVSASDFARSPPGHSGDTVGLGVGYGIVFKACQLSYFRKTRLVRFSWMRFRDILQPPLGYPVIIPKTDWSRELVL